MIPMRFIGYGPEKTTDLKSKGITAMYINDSLNF